MAQYSIWFYPSDAFVGGLPDEQSAVATGGSTQVLTLLPGAQMIELVIEDNEGDFGEEINGPTQSIVNAVTIGGTTYPAGSNVVTAYDLTNTSSGHQVTSFHITSGDGYTVGPVQGIVTTQPMVPGQDYTFNQNVSSYQQNNPYNQFVCFARGGLILTADGERRVEDLRVGDLVKTRDSGMKAIRWIGSRVVAARGNLAPVTIKAGAFGHVDERAVPHSDLTVSPQHRILLSGWRCELVVGEEQALVAAKHLCSNDMIYAAPHMTVEYFHLMFDEHEIIYANGAETESFHPGVMGKSAVGQESWTEICTLFPELAVNDNKRPICYPQASPSEARVLLG